MVLLSNVHLIETIETPSVSPVSLWHAIDGCGQGADVKTKEKCTQ